MRRSWTWWCASQRASRSTTWWVGACRWGLWLCLWCEGRACGSPHRCSRVATALTSARPASPGAGQGEENHERAEQDAAHRAQLPRHHQARCAGAAGAGWRLHACACAAPHRFELVTPDPLTPCPHCLPYPPSPHPWQASARSASCPATSTPPARLASCRARVRVGGGRALPLPGCLLLFGERRWRCLLALHLGGGVASTSAGCAAVCQPAPPHAPLTSPPSPHLAPLLNHLPTHPPTAPPPAQAR